MAESPRLKRNSKSSRGDLGPGDDGARISDAEAGDDSLADFPTGGTRIGANDEDGIGKREAERKDATLELERAKKKTAGTEKPSVSIVQLFQFADGTDVVLIIVGSLAAAVNGASQPLMTVFFGQIINAFGENVTDNSRLIHEVSQVALRFVYLSLAAGVAAYLETTCWMISAERQASRIRSQYFRAILRQDITFFDTQTSTGEVIARMSGDTVLVQQALGDKAGKLIEFFASFVAGFIVAFTRSWKLTLVVMSVMPVVVVVGSIMGIFLSKMTSIAQDAYAEAGTLVEQVIGSMRTVS